MILFAHLKLISYLRAQNTDKQNARAQYLHLGLGKLRIGSTNSELIGHFLSSDIRLAIPPQRYPLQTLVQRQLTPPLNHICENLGWQKH